MLNAEDRKKVEKLLTTHRTAHDEVPGGYMPVLAAEEADILRRAYFEGDSDALDDVEPIISRLLDAADA